MPYTAHLDTFARDHLPPAESQPAFLFDLPELQFPERLNCATELLDRAVKEGRGDRPCVSAPEGPSWTYAELQRQADRIAHVLVKDCGLVPGNRVLLRSTNKPMAVACWFAIMKAGGIAVATMPMLRAKELKQIVEKGQVDFALCDQKLRGDLEMLLPVTPVLQRIVCFGDPSPDGLEALMSRHDESFANVDTAADDTCLLAFTSGTTGQPKATMHFHRDVMASCVCFPKHVLRADENDVFIGSPPLAFTFGLGGLTLFPMHVGASTVLLERAGPNELLDAVVAHRATVLFTAPTSYRAMAPAAKERRIGVRDGGVLRKCVSAGEVLPAPTRVPLARGDGHRADRRHRRDRDAAHLHFRRRGRGPPGCHRQGDPRLPRQGRRRRRQRTPAGDDRQARGAGPDRLPLPRRPAPGELRARTAGTTPATPT
jgi:2-aminobenzoate-CoA ligase